jgi:5'-AMP-activated protein kinase, regulatory gamma subunit
LYPVPLYAQSGPGSMADLGGSIPYPGTPKQRVFTCTRRDTLRSIVEKLSIPGIRRLVVISPDTNRVEGIISLCDVAAFLLAPE